MLEWIKDRVILGSFYCTLWEDDYVLQGKRVQYVKRCTLWPSLIITGKMIHDAKARQRQKKRTRVIWCVYTRKVTLRFPFPSLVRV